MTPEHAVYIQVSTSDRQSTARFYADIFHWKIHHESGYTWFEADSAAPLEAKPELAPFIVLVEPNTSIAYTRSA